MVYFPQEPSFLNATIAENLSVLNPDITNEKLNEVTANVCYDVSSVINAVGDLDIPASNDMAEAPEKTSDDIYAMLLEKSDDITAMLDEKTDNFTAMLEENTDERSGEEDRSSDQDEYQADGVMTQEKILQILNAAKSTAK